MVFDRELTNTEEQNIRRGVTLIARPTYQRFQYNPDSWEWVKEHYLLAKSGNVSVDIKTPRTFSGSYGLYNVSEEEVKRLSEFTDSDFSELGYNNKNEFLLEWGRRFPNSYPAQIEEYIFDPWIIRFRLE